MFSKKIAQRLMDNPELRELRRTPGNTELLAQRHRLLGEEVSETKEKLETLKTAAETLVGKNIWRVA